MPCSSHLLWSLGSNAERSAFIGIVKSGSGKLRVERRSIGRGECTARAFFHRICIGPRRPTRLMRYNEVMVDASLPSRDLVRYLFLDLNAYFASVEQQERP